MAHVTLVHGTSDEPPEAGLLDQLDPVCGFDPALGDDFGKAGEAAIPDAAVRHDGAWRHSVTKYLRQRAFGQALRRMPHIEHRRL